MDFRGRNKISAEFSMASMTDIVFLLLIFFMLTSTLVTTSALDLILPKSKAETVKKQDISVAIKKDLKILVNDRPVGEDQLESELLRLTVGRDAPVLILFADESVPTGKVVKVMDIAYRNRMKMVLATDPK
ncbi:ExbD/TolR family protein [Schleiferia thermophila]|jgi:biopolymer transport protein ExbD|uniref:Outer membrane transport energization protein ExbD n=1 Tax=Schleiferia thermophila TaxID=884107 RepID=A0A369A2I9_9FLAO|nr:biopolymer transporter ExbD [Schleiferia thermophila]KFD39149.1 biopolymer transportern ExbD [Schleiferia thermophila str. Yellowstone]RCX03363.1 outer membrane transport energization protein ExbD [Schleiferia thermophila]GCD80492.1 biopolymer transporter ExbD [Schleiferia thermophila]